MKKRWIVVGAIALIVVAGVTIAAMNLNAWLEDNRPMIEEEASAALGRAVTIGGLGVQIWGGFGVAVNELSVQEDPLYGDGAFLTLESGVVRVSILSAIFGRIEIGDVVLEAPEIRVIRDDRGLSIDSLMATEDDTAEESEATMDLTISRLRIEQGRIVFEDRTPQGAVESVVDGVDLVVEDVSATQPLHFELEASLLGAESANLFGEGTAGPVLAPAGTPLAFDVELRLDALSLADVAKVEDVAVSMPEGTRIDGVLDATLKASGVPDKIAFQVEIDATRSVLVSGEDFAKPAGVALVVDANGVALPEAADVERFAVNLAGAKLDGRARVGLDDVGAYDVTIRGVGVPLAGWGELLPAAEGLPVEGRLGLDVRARGRTSSEKSPSLDGKLALDDVAVRMPDTPPVEHLTARVTFAGTRAEVRETSFDVGGAPVTMQADIANVNAPDVRFALDAERLPLAALDVIEPGTEDDDHLRNLRVVGRADLRTEELVADARFASPAGRLQAVDYTDLSGSASMVGDRIQLDETTLLALGGKVAVSGVLDETAADRPSYDGRLVLSGVRVEELIRARYPSLGRPASGRIDTTLTFGAAGIDTDSLLRSVTANGRFRVREGTLYDVNIAEEALRGATGVPGLSRWLSPELRKKHPKLFTTGNTEFKALGAGFEVVKGLLRTNDLAIEAQEFGLQGGGTIGLDGRVDLETRFAANPALASNLVEDVKATRYLLDKTGRIVFPVRIEGTLTSLKFRPDEKFIADGLARAAVDTVGSVVGGLLGTRGTQEKAEDPEADDAPLPSSETKPESEAGKAERKVKKGLEDLFGK